MSSGPLPSCHHPKVNKQGQKTQVYHTEFTSDSVRNQCFLSFQFVGHENYNPFPNLFSSYQRLPLGFVEITNLMSEFTIYRLLAILLFVVSGIKLVSVVVSIPGWGTRIYVCLLMPLWQYYTCTNLFCNSLFDTLMFPSPILSSPPCPPKEKQVTGYVPRLVLNRALQ